MYKRNVLGLVLAATVAVSMAGCKTPAQAGNQNTPGANQPATGGQLAGAKQSAGSENAQATAEAMGDEREMDDFDYMADSPAAAGYATQALSDAVKARIKARLSADVSTKLGDRHDRIKQRIQARLMKKAAITAKLKDALMKAPETTDENGNKTREFTFDADRAMTANGQTRTQTMAVTATRTVSADGVLLHSKYEATQTDSNGRSRKITREKTLDTATGVYTVVFHRERTGKNGMMYTADWNKTIAAEGGVSGTGTIMLKKADGTTKTKNVTFGGTVEAPKAEVADTEAGVTAAVTLPVEGEATAVVSDPASGATAPATVEEETEVVAETEATAAAS